MSENENKLLVWEKPQIFDMQPSSKVTLDCGGGSSYQYDCGTGFTPDGACHVGDIHG